MFNNKKDPLVDSVAKVMQESEKHRKIVASVNEQFGVPSRAALTREKQAEYDAVLAEALKGNQHKIDANKNGKVDAHDFKLLRAKKEAEPAQSEMEESSHKTMKEGSPAKAAMTFRQKKVNENAKPKMSASDIAGATSQASNPQKAQTLLKTVDKAATVGGAVGKIAGKATGVPGAGMIAGRIAGDIAARIAAKKAEKMNEGIGDFFSRLFGGAPSAGSGSQMGPAPRPQSSSGPPLGTQGGQAPRPTTLAPKPAPVAPVTRPTTPAMNPRGAGGAGYSMNSGTPTRIEPTSPATPAPAGAPNRATAYAAARSAAAAAPKPASPAPAKPAGGPPLGKLGGQAPAAAPAPRPTPGGNAKPAETKPQTFAQAFAAARKAAGGPGGKFTYNGKEYQTNVKGEKYVDPSKLKKV